MERARKILRDGFKVKRGKVTNDLGSGVYTYCDDKKQIWNPCLNAERFARRFRNGQICVLKLTVDDNKIRKNSLNLDGSGIDSQWEIFRQYLEKEANKKWRSLPHSKAKKRHNIDGIILEDGLLNKGFLLENNTITHPSCVLKQTYTSFVPRTISNFANGRELVIRDLGIITAIEIQKN